MEKKIKEATEFLKTKGIHPIEPIYWNLENRDIYLHELLAEFKSLPSEREAEIRKEIEELKAILNGKIFEGCLNLEDNVKEEFGIEAYQLMINHTSNCVAILQTEITSLKQQIEEYKNQSEWLRKFVWEDTINLSHDFKNLVPPFRVGKRQKRAILDSRGHEAGVFVTGMEEMALTFCNFLNGKSLSTPVSENKLSGTIDEGKKEGEWISVEERLPDRVFGVITYSEKFGFDCRLGAEVSLPQNNITHWMPLPKAPIKSKEEGK
jgi:hypothetical protein